MSNKSGTQTITTKRLLLRRFTLADAPAMYHNWATDEKTVEFLSWDIHESENLTRALIGQWIENYKSSEYYNWLIEYEGEPVGNISVVRQSKAYYGFKELGYCLGSRWWNLGLMSEAVSAVCDYLFRETETHRIVIRHAVANTGSGRVAEKCGFTFEGIEREAYINRDGRFCDIRVNSLLRHEWKRMGSKDRIVLETERLRIRPMTSDDFEAVHAYAGNSENTKYMLFGTNDEKATMDFLRMCECEWAHKEVNTFEFAIELKENGKVIGGCDISFDETEGCVGWILHRDWWNRGLITEAGKALIDYAFETLGLLRITATCDTENAASRRVMEKLGMTQEGKFRKNRYYREAWHDEYHYAILREEWEAQNAQTR